MPAKGFKSPHLLRSSIKNFEVRNDLLTNHNARVIDTLMIEHSKKKGSVFDMENPILKTIFKRVTRNS